MSHSAAELRNERKTGIEFERGMTLALGGGIKTKPYPYITNN